MIDTNWCCIEEGAFVGTNKDSEWKRTVKQ
jgi:hypothetical protein